MTAFLVLLVASLAGLTDRSLYETHVEPLGRDSDRAELVVEVLDTRSTAEAALPLPIRVIVTAGDGSHPDGSGRGTYADGRFFAEGSFTVEIPHGRTRISLRAGPSYEPLEVELDAEAGRRTRIEARLHRWFAPEERGWYGGDNHVHAQHDATAVVKTDLAYTALQARANGLSIITESGSNVDYTDMQRLSSPMFLFRFAPELRPGPFVGHLNTPGLNPPLPDDVYERLVDQPLPAMALVEEVHRRGGAVIHTHPLVPPHQLHWMGAAEFLSDAVLGRPADAIDIDGRASEWLWFAALNLGNRIAASGSTDSALGRRNSPSPGDRRVYCHADELRDTAIAAAIRSGRTFATNGGPIFPFATLDGHEPGDTVEPAGNRPHVLRAEIHSLHPLRSVQLIRRGDVVKTFDIVGRSGEVVLEAELVEGPEARSWYVLRAEDDQGHWAITSPVYVEPQQQPAARRPAASAMILEIHNATRFIELRRTFFAHVMVTVDHDDRLETVEILKDGAVLHRFLPELGDERPSGKVPVTGMGGVYEPGWAWHPATTEPGHLQADWPIDQTGWYSLEARTAGGRTLSSDEIYFDADSEVSHAVSLAHLDGPGTSLAYRGYGEEMPLKAIRTPFEGDHWWYPEQTYWNVHAKFGHTTDEVGGGPNPGASARFRTSSPDGS